MGNSINVDERTLAQIDMLIAEDGYASADDLVRKLVDEHLALREMRAAVSAGLESPAHPLTAEMQENIKATMRGNGG